MNYVKDEQRNRCDIFSVHNNNITVNSFMEKKQKDAVSNFFCLSLNASAQKFPATIHTAYL